MELIKLLSYYFLTSFLRQKIDQSLRESQHLFKGKILDIGGGRKRGDFRLSKKKKLTVVDIEKKLRPDIVASVEKLPFKNSFFDVVKATELFEHVRNPEKGIKECVRVLKPKGYFIFSMPFLYPIHADPNDYQRWTEAKIRAVLKRNSLKIKKIKILGYYFSVLADFIKRPITNINSPLRYLFYILFFPIIYFLYYLDNKINKKNFFLKEYHLGYFVICRK